jgi:hypothetical protein
MDLRDTTLSDPEHPARFWESHHRRREAGDAGPNPVLVEVAATRDATRALGIEVRSGLHTGKREVVDGSSVALRYISPHESLLAPNRAKCSFADDQ